MLKINRLSKKFRNRCILKDVNIEIANGSVGVFLGGSGVGKSTLLRVLNNLESYDSGTITLNNKPLNLFNANRDNTIGMVFQHFNLFEHLSVEENITLALVKCKGVDKSAATHSAHALLERYELITKSKERASNLSGGQKQRLAIARTLALDPQIICLDEPTSALDPRLTAQVAKFIDELTKENRIVLLTTHDMNLVELLDGQLFLMEEGSIAESAQKRDCFSHPSLYPKLNHFLNGYKAPFKITF